jgi:hypothetical protein
MLKLKIYTWNILGNIIFDFFIFLKIGVVKVDVQKV